ncbi:MAG TPA: poly-beta-hydroxybutyrate-responsive repressor [Bacillota bacterium]|nr:poly-beta-hydroxybutyrate-responsive repressor [Bacillota bacterium]
MKADDKWTIPGGPPKNMMVPVLLLILNGWNAHGYELIQQLMRFGFQSIDQGNVYRTLRQLEKDNMVKSVWDTTSGGPAKRVYSITDAGKEYLESWATVLEQYQRMLDQFFNMYTQFFIPIPGLKPKMKDEEEQD